MNAQAKTDLPSGNDNNSGSLTALCRSLLTLTTTVLVLLAIGWAINRFYALAALLGSVLIVAYLLLGPVNLLEAGLTRLLKKASDRQSTDGSRLVDTRENVVGQLVQISGNNHLRVLAVLIVYVIFLGSLFFATMQVPVLVNQMGELSSKLGGQVVAFSGHAMDWADHSAGPGTVRKLFSQEIVRAEHQGRIIVHQRHEPISGGEKRIIQESVIQNSMNQMERLVAAALPVTLNNFAALMGGTLRAVLYCLTALLMTFFFLTDGRRLRLDVMALFPQKSHPSVNYLMDTFHEIMFSFIRGQVMLGILTGCYMFVIYSIFSVPYAFLLASLFALAELLPVVGTWLGISIGLLVILFNMDPLTAVWVWLCSYAYQTVKDNILAPKVVGDVMGLHPLVIILSLLVCAQVAGLLGVLIALPLASAVNVVIRMLLHKSGPNAYQVKTAAPDASASTSGGKPDA